MCMDISFPWNLFCWQPYTPIYTGSTFLKNSYIKILKSFQLCLISFNLSQNALHRSKYSSGAFSINFSHSDTLASVLTANRTCSLSMALIEQEILSNRQSSSHITSLFIYSKLPAFLLITKYSLFLEFSGVFFWFWRIFWDG